MGEVEKEVFEDRPSKAAMEELMEDHLSRVAMKGGVIPNLAESLPTDPSLPSLPSGFSVFLQGKDIISPFSWHSLFWAHLLAFILFFLLIFFFNILLNNLLSSSISSAQFMNLFGISNVIEAIFKSHEEVIYFHLLF